MNTENIFDITDNFIERLTCAATRGTLIPFIGAGVSKLAGCPGWDSFADMVMRQLIKKRAITHAQSNQIQNQPTRVKLSIARSIQESKKIALDFNKVFHVGGRETHSQGLEIYSTISKIGKTFITTNYDEWLDNEIRLPELLTFTPQCANQAIPVMGKQRKVYDNPFDFTPNNMNKLDVTFHLHGTMKNPASMIITTRDYIEHYADNRFLDGQNVPNPIPVFLEHLFLNKNILFIGYGLEELEILEYIILKARRSTKGDFVDEKHFMLQGFYSHQCELIHFLKRYYSEFGIELVPFCLDNEDWNQLGETLKIIANKVQIKSVLPIQERQEMRSLLDA